MMKGTGFLVVAVVTLITIIAWAVLDTIHRRAAVEVSAEWTEAAEPIDSNFDLKVLEEVYESTP